MGEVLAWWLGYLNSHMIDKLLKSPRKELLQQTQQIEWNRQRRPYFQMPAATSWSVSFSDPKIKNKEGKESTSIIWQEMQDDVSEITMQVKLAFVVTESDELLFPHSCFSSSRKNNSLQVIIFSEQQNMRLFPTMRWWPHCKTRVTINLGMWSCPRKTAVVHIISFTKIL